MRVLYDCHIYDEQTIIKFYIMYRVVHSSAVYQ